MIHNQTIDEARALHSLSGGANGIGWSFNHEEGLVWDIPSLVIPAPTAEEIAAEIIRLDSLEPQRLLNIESLEYLKSTDWYITRHAETAVAVPDEITTARAAAREAIV